MWYTRKDSYTVQGSEVIESDSIFFYYINVLDIIFIELTKSMMQKVVKNEKTLLQSVLTF